MMKLINIMHNQIKDYFSKILVKSQYFVPKKERKKIKEKIKRKRKRKWTKKKKKKNKRENKRKIKYFTNIYFVNIISIFSYFINI